MLVVAERHGVGIVFDRVLDAGGIEIDVPAVQAQDRAHFAPVLERVGRVGVGIDADAVGLAVPARWSWFRWRPWRFLFSIYAALVAGGVISHSASS